MEAEGGAPQMELRSGGVLSGLPPALQQQAEAVSTLKRRPAMQPAVGSFFC